MLSSAPSALITDDGRRVLLRIKGQQYELSQEELRTVLGLPSGPLGLGISIDQNRIHFEFIDEKTLELSSEQLHRKLSKQLTSGT